MRSRSWLLLLLGLSGLTLVGCPTPTANDDDVVSDDDDATGDDDDATEDAIPGDVTGLSATPAEGQIDLAWTNPTDEDFAATVVVVGSSISFTPTAGETYTADQDLGEGQTVAVVDAGTTGTWAISDGASLEFAAWAVDAGGNYSANPATASADPIPGAPTDLTATAAGVNIDLAWTRATDTDLAGTLIVAGTEPIIFTPTADTTYTAGEDLGNGETVLYVSPSEAESYMPALIGPDLFYAAWSVDGGRSYSAESATASERRLALGTQTATLEVSIANGTVTVTSQPTDLTLAGSAVEYSGEGESLTFTLSTQNDTGRILFNLKSITDGVTGGTQAGDTLWTESDKPYVYYGPEGILPGSAVERQFSLTAVDGVTDPVLLELHFADAPMIFGGNYGGDFTGVDTAMSGETFSEELNHPDDAGDNVRQAVISRDARWIYAGEKHSPLLTIIDTTTFEVTGGTNLNVAANGEGNVGGVAISPDGRTLYAVYNDGVHWHGWSDAANSAAAPSTVSVLAFDTATMTETDRFTLYTDDALSRTGREMAIHPDGSQVAVVVSNHDGDLGELWLFDAETLDPIDVAGVGAGDDDDSAGDDDDSAGDDDDSAAGEAPRAGRLVLTGLGQPMYLDWSGDGATLAVGYNAHRYGPSGTAPVDLVSPSDFSVQTVTPNSTGETSSVNTAWGGMLYYASREPDVSGSSLQVIDMATGAQTDIAVLNGTTSVSELSGVLVEPSGERFWAVDDDEVYPFDLATSTQIDGDGDSTNGMTLLDAGEDMRAHFMLMTPF